MLSRNNFYVTCTLLGKQLYFVLFAKDLSVTMYASLNFHEHITNVVSSFTNSLCQIIRAKYLLGKQTKITLIDALVFSNSYCKSTTWSSTSKKQIQTVFNFTARILTCINNIQTHMKWNGLQFIFKSNSVKVLLLSNV